MRELALYALLNGVFTTAKLHDIDELTVRIWLRKIDYENCDFFKAVREFVVKTALKVGPEKVSELLGIPIWTVKTLVSEYGPALQSEVKSRQISVRELMRRARLLHAQGFDLEFIAASTQQSVAIIAGWLEETKRQPLKLEVKQKDEDLFEQMREDAVKHDE
mmetsp:Transcript_7228/g.13361  ORF Transcript_7228/g.13361 Transcript_7228/m.13361 type:complete len:162 (-) Transcript_7228:1323-1808(-)|eukprot:CAMPEP_0204898912 /NCGR_PEP_ID=MMETSP1397-20131031/1551_1 /ASSEMBLY_ACC=CAM_ASM_000891 /TAXON_ID=49980 /ORGANISM="Climacostomum Climacostomum virens, Strain Stock W-24" /LENGTH=161 /DNA_ID=CAMNT_0052066803 /DNA_START=940 /DNA_END=1425 /DNA_ORIENTATION=-